MKIVGLDVGSKTIGVAVSDEMGIIARAVTTLKRKGMNHDVAQVLKLIEEQKAGKVVVGLPKNMNGSLGQSAKMVLELLKELEKSVDIPVIAWDERLSTVAAERTLLEANMSRKKRKKVIDKIAALIILQGYLDNQKRMRDIS